MKILTRFAVVILGLIIFLPSLAYSGSLDAPASPTNVNSAMFSLEDIFKELGSSTPTVVGSSTTIPAVKRGGATLFVEPAAGPASTGRTLDDVMDLVRSRARLSETGQIVCYDVDGSVITCGVGTGTAQDGHLKRGVAWPNPRFTDNGAGTGTVVDNLTNLIWLKQASCFGAKTWVTALADANALAGDGSCGLSDGSVAGDWRLPNVKELQSLIDFSKSSPALQTDPPFASVQNTWYWSSTTPVSNPSSAWSVLLGSGVVDNRTKTDQAFVWPVRGGQ